MSVSDQWLGSLLYGLLSLEYMVIEAPHLIRKGLRYQESVPFLCLIGEETKAWEGKQSGPGPHGEIVTGWGIKPGTSSPGSELTHSISNCWEALFILVITQHASEWVWSSLYNKPKAVAARDWWVAQQNLLQGFLTFFWSGVVEWKFPPNPCPPTRSHLGLH